MKLILINLLLFFIFSTSGHSQEMKCNSFSFNLKLSNNSDALLFKSENGKNTIEIKNEEVIINDKRFNNNEIQNEEEDQRKQYSWLQYIYTFDNHSLSLKYCIDDEVYIETGLGVLKLINAKVLVENNKLDLNPIEGFNLVRSQIFSKAYFEKNILNKKIASILDSVMKNKILLEKYLKQRASINSKQKYNLDLLKNLLSFSDKNKYKYNLGIKDFKINKFYVVFTDSEKYPIEQEEKFNFYQSIIKKYNCPINSLIFNYGQLEFQRVDNKWEIVDIDFSPDLNMFSCMRNRK